MNSNYTERKKSTIATRSNSGESVADFVFGTHPTHHHNIWFKIVTSTNLSEKAISLKNRMVGNTSEYLYEIIKIAKNSGRSISYDIRFVTGIRKCSLVIPQSSMKMYSKE